MRISVALTSWLFLQTLSVGCANTPQQNAQTASTQADASPTATTSPESAAPAASEAKSPVAQRDIDIVPAPVSVQRGQGHFQITSDTVLRYQVSSVASRDAATFLASRLRPSTGFALELKPDHLYPQTQNTIHLTTNGADPKLGPEGYELVVDTNSVVIRANAPAGMFYGVQSLRQLLPPQIETAPGKLAAQSPDSASWTVPAVQISDQPRFKWRGAMLDVARHFRDKEDVKRFLDVLALHKFNTFHFHLTEDQGWRIEIKKYPRLTSHGAFRKQTPIPANREQGDGKPYGGFYTQEDIKEIVAYATKLHITVVPEIEMPGHALAAISAYPELGNFPEVQHEVGTRWGVFEQVYGVQDQTFTFLEDVLTEVLALFPGPFVHVGGDECPKEEWKRSPVAQAKIKKEKLKDEHELQSYFIRHFDKFLADRGRRLIGWDEILEGGLAPGAAVMSWRGTEGGLKAASMGHDVVMSPTTHVYLDYYQSEDQKNEPPAIGGFLPFEKVYSFEPIPEGLPADKHHHILGAQGNIWTEYIPTRAQLEYMAFPRLIALSEVVWSPKQHRNLEQFRQRLPARLDQLKAMGVNFRPLDPPKQNN